MRKYQFHPTKYFKVPLKKIHATKVRPFPLFIYLVRNDHLLMRFDVEQETAHAQLETYAKAGLENFWCPVEFDAAWQQYLKDNPGENGIEISGPKQPDPPSLAAAEEAKKNLGEQTLDGRSAPSDKGEQTLDGKEARTDKGEQTLANDQSKEDLGEQTLDGKEARTDKGEQTLANDQSKEDLGEQTLDGKEGRKDLGEQTLEGKEAREDLGEQTLSQDPEQAKAVALADSIAQTLDGKSEIDDEALDGPDGVEKKAKGGGSEGEPTEREAELAALVEEIASDQARSEDAAAAIDILTAQGISEEEKREALHEISQNLMKSLADVNSENPEERENAFNKAKEFAEDIITVLAQNHRMGKLFDDIRNIKDMDSPHSSAVSAYAIIIAMGVGFTEQESLGDIAFGATLHDVGLVNVDPKILAKAEKDFTPEDRLEYQKHVTSSIEELEKKRTELTPGVREIIEQHHERWDGSGYPKALKGFQVSELAQVVGIADYLDDLMAGRIDGKVHGPSEALDVMEVLQDSDGANQQLFAPELYESLAQIIRSTRVDSDAPQGAGVSTEASPAKPNKEAA